MFKSDLDKLADTLDEHILKGLKPRRISKVEQAEAELHKSLSHDPFSPFEMTQDSPFYNPYRNVDGAYLPYSADYWESQGKDRDAYLTTTNLYARLGGVNKSLGALKKMARFLGQGDLIKGGAVPIGTVHTYRDGQRYKKVADGKWTPMAGLEKHTVKDAMTDKNPARQELGHQAVEQHAEKTGRLKELLDQKLKDQKVIHESTTEGVKQTMAHVKTLMSKLYDGPMPKELEDHIENVISSAGLPKDLREKIKRGGKGEGREVNLSEQEVNHLLKSGKYALVSAGKNPAHPEDMKLGDDAIKSRYHNLRQQLVDDGFAFSKVTGHYGGVEDSFLVMVHEADKDSIKKMGKTLNQDSVIYSEGGKSEMHFTTGKNAGTHHKGEGFSPEAKDAKDFYSEMTTSDGKKVKFALNFDFSKHHDEKGDVVKQEAPKAEAKKEEPKQDAVGGKKHKVSVSFSHGGKKYDHEFNDVAAQGTNHAQQKVQDAITQKLGRGVQFHKFHSEVNREAKP